jgi:serine/threonine protein kinase
MAQDPLPLAQLRGADLAVPEVEFTDGQFLYLTSGQKLGHGGMGNVWTVTRRPLAGDGAPLTVVAKSFREEFLFLLREDEQARRRFDHFERVIDQLRGLSHPNVLPVEMMAPISDNYILVTPLAGSSLLQLLPQQPLSPRERVQLFAEALRGLKALHERGIVHRDFTLNNVLAARVDGAPTSAVVFDFDLSVVPELLAPEDRNYASYYQGRVLGSPEFSIAPELLDDVLGLEPISPRIDVYSAGTALFALFTELSVYGDAPDLSALFFRIVEGVVRSGESRVPYPDAVPKLLRPIIDGCLEREPAARFADASALLTAVEHALEEMAPPPETEELRTTFRRSGGLDYIYTRITLTDEERFAEKAHPQVSRDEITRMEGVLAQHGYLVERALGRVKGHPIFLALPDPELVAEGRFPEDNPYRKIVTAIDLTTKEEGFLETWLGRIHPILMRVRQGYLTALYKVAREGDLLLLFSEYVADARFGTDLAHHDLTLEEVMGLGLIVGRTIERLHDSGLAHNNVRAESLVFKGHRDAGRVQSLFVGLVEPSFAPEALVEDVRNLAGMLAPLMRQSRVDALRPTVRPLIERLRERLRKMAAGEARTVSIKAFLDLLSDGLGAIEPNFDLVRAHKGNTTAYADLLVRHSLFNRLYAIDVAAVG